MNNLRLQYKKETGKTPQEKEFSVTRRKKLWVIDPQEHVDAEIIDFFGKTGTIYLQDNQYMEWLEDKLTELQKT